MGNITVAALSSYVISPEAFFGIFAAFALFSTLCFCYLYYRLRSKCNNLQETNIALHKHNFELEELLQSMAQLGNISYFIGNADNNCEADLKIAESYISTMLPVDQVNFRKKYLQLLNNELKDFYANTTQKKTGQYKRHLNFVKLITLPDNSCRKFILISMDRSTQENQHTMLANADLLLQAIFDYLPGFIVLKNISSDFSYIRCNPGFSALLQKKPEDLQGKTDFDIFDRDLAQRIRTVDMEIVRTHSIADNQWFFSTPDGKEHAMRFISRIIKRADGSELILGVGIDITKHESMNSKLRKRNKELRLLLSQQEKPLMLLDNNLTLVGATPNMQKHLSSYLKADMTLQCSDLCRKLPAKPEECPAYQTLQDGQIRYCHNCVLAASGLKLQRPLSPPGSDYYVAAGIEPHSEESHYTVNSEENEL